MIIVAKLTGWGLAELRDEPVDELLAWHKVVDKVEKEIAAKIKKR